MQTSRSMTWDGKVQFTRSYISPVGKCQLTDCWPALSAWICLQIHQIRPLRTLSPEEGWKGGSHFCTKLSPPCLFVWSSKECNHLTNTIDLLLRCQNQQLLVTGHFCVSTLSQRLCSQTAKSLDILYTKMQMKVTKKLNVNKPDHMGSNRVVNAEGDYFLMLCGFLCLPYFLSLKGLMKMKQNTIYNLSAALK